MKRVLSVILALVVCLSLCACGESTNEENTKTPSKKSSTMTTQKAAEQTVPRALEEWMSTKFLALECSDFDYSITHIERSNIQFVDNSDGMMWYNAYGEVQFYNQYGDLLMTGDFTVVFGHNGKSSVSVVSSDTVVTPRY